MKFLILDELLLLLGSRVSAPDRLLRQCGRVVNHAQVCDDACIFSQCSVASRRLLLVQRCHKSALIVLHDHLASKPTKHLLTYKTSTLQCLQHADPSINHTSRLVCRWLNDALTDFVVNCFNRMDLRRSVLLIHHHLIRFFLVSFYEQSLAFFVNWLRQIQ